MSDYKHKHKLDFSRGNRLLTADDYQQVFKSAKHFGNHCFTLLVRKNNLDHPRLGLAISKKCAKKAVDRNRIKRIFRESFRLNQETLATVDIVAMCKSGAIKLEKNEIRRQIEQQWLFINKKFNRLEDSADQETL